MDMNDFPTKGHPTPDQWQAATEGQLLERLLNHQFPGEDDLLKIVLAVRAAETNRATNAALVRSSMRLVWATWALCVCTLVAAFVVAWLSRK